MNNHCKATNESGPCRRRAFAGEDLCFWHHPDYENERQEARRAGGLARRREAVIKEAYGLTGVPSLEEAARLTDIAASTLLGLENTVAKARGLLNAAQTTLKIHEVANVAEDVAEVKAVMDKRIEDESSREKRRRRWLL